MNVKKTWKNIKRKIPDETIDKIDKGVGKIVTDVITFICTGVVTWFVEKQIAKKVLR